MIGSGALLSFGLPYLTLNLAWCAIFHPTIGIGRVEECITTIENGDMMVESVIQITSLYFMIFIFLKLFP
jgi:hypothetical protein